MSTYEVIILGAGASGLACGAVAVERGRKVLILDHTQKAACKVGISGGGKANFTNMHMGVEHFYGSNPKFCLSALKRFTPYHALDWLAKNDVAYEERAYGQMFCSRSAKDLVRTLVTDVQDCHCLYNTEIIDVQHKNAMFFVTTKEKTYTSESLVIALGSKTFPQTGATDLGIKLASQFGHTYTPYSPALVGLVMGTNWAFSSLAGISLPVEISIKEKQSLHNINSQNSPALKPQKQKKQTQVVLQQEALPLLFTHTGISGPAVLQASLFWEQGDTLIVNFLPNLFFTEEALAPEYGRLQIKTLLVRLFPERFAESLMRYTGVNPQQRVAEMSKKDRTRLNEAIHFYTITPQKTEGFLKAEVAKGGVHVDEVSSRSMESTVVPKLFFCGEVLDVAGRLGGYNLHWAFASGRVAGAFA